MAAVVFVLLLVGVGLLARGLRGRRTDDHPICRRCGYDLTCRPPTTTRCGECGGDLTRRRRPGAVAAAVLILALACGFVGRPLTEAVRDPRRYQPVWWLRIDLGRDVARQNALRELDRRAATGRLSPSQAAGVVDTILGLQADTRRSWQTGLGSLVERLRASHQVTDGQWQRFARQAVTFRLRVRPRVRRGDPVPAEIQQLQARDGGSVEFRLAMWPVNDPSLGWVGSTDGGGGPLFDGPVVPDETGWSDCLRSAGLHLRPGPSGNGREPAEGEHAVAVKFHIVIRESLAGPPVVAEDVELPARFGVVPATSDTVRPADPAFVSSLLSDFEVNVVRDRATRRLQTTVGPVRMIPMGSWGYPRASSRFGLSLRSTTAERDVGECATRRQDVSLHPMADCDLPDVRGGTIGVVVRSTPAMARDTVDQTMYLEHEVVIPGVRVP